MRTEYQHVCPGIPIMLIVGNRLPGKPAMRGFSLIELMVAMVIGMIVMAGAIALIVAINKANSETIQSTRLNQELRTLAGVISSELKRTRRLHDPIFNISQGAITNGTFDLVNYSTDGCILYGYQDPTMNDASSTADATNNYRVIRLSITGGVGSVIFASSNAAVNCNTNGTALNSTQINITAMKFNCATTTTGLTTTQAQEACSEIDLSLTGNLTSGDAYMRAISRTYTQPIFIRSGSVKTS